MISFPRLRWRIASARVISKPVAELLRFCAVGSVDDGKSTLIGRLLNDTKQLFDDQVEAIAEASRRRGYEGVELAFVTDGLRAEREQGITIDVAYRYAATPNRKYVIADCPGHEQYTRNMATGASTAELAVVVIDAARGLREQTKRHLCIAALMGVRRFVVCVNKMDLVDWSEEIFDSVVEQMKELTDKLGIEDLIAIPVSALTGEGVVEPVKSANWYRGQNFVEVLESVQVVGSDLGTGGARLPVQWVFRNPDGTRGYAGLLSGGPLRAGNSVVVQPSGKVTQIVSVYNFDGPLQVAWPGMSVSVSIDDELDIGRGDMFVSSGDSQEPGAGVPEPRSELGVMVCWFSDKPLVAGNRYSIKHTTRRAPCIVTSVQGVLDVNTMEVSDADEIRANGIGRVNLTVSVPLAVDSYRDNRATGSFVIVDPVTNATLGAGMVEGADANASLTGSS